MIINKLCYIKIINLFLINDVFYIFFIFKSINIWLFLISFLQK